MTSCKFSYHFDVRPYLLDCYQSTSISLGPKWGHIAELSYWNSGAVWNCQQYVQKRWGGSWSQVEFKTRLFHLQVWWSWARGKTTHGIPVKIIWKNIWKVLACHDAWHITNQVRISQFIIIRGKIPINIFLCMFLC